MYQWKVALSSLTFQEIIPEWWHVVNQMNYLLLNYWTTIVYNSLFLCQIRAQDWWGAKDMTTAIKLRGMLATENLHRKTKTPKSGTKVLCSLRQLQVADKLVLRLIRPQFWVPIKWQLDSGLRLTRWISEFNSWGATSIRRGQHLQSSILEVAWPHQGNNSFEAQVSEACDSDPDILVPHRLPGHIHLPTGPVCCKLYKVKCNASNASNPWNVWNANNQLKQLKQLSNLLSSRSVGLRDIWRLCRWQWFTSEPTLLEWWWRWNSETLQTKTK